MSFIKKELLILVRSPQELLILLGMPLLLITILGFALGSVLEGDRAACDRESSTYYAHK